MDDVEFSALSQLLDGTVFTEVQPPFVPLALQWLAVDDNAS